MTLVEQTEQLMSIQFARFEQELSTMMRDHAGEWVVYLDYPRCFFATEAEAIKWAFGSLGHRTGFVVAKVAAQIPVPITAALTFIPREHLLAELTAARRVVEIATTLRNGNETDKNWSRLDDALADYAAVRAR